ncbi:hypothetical protein [Kozakia baliensis]|uniref:hypothetical protein n=1 Tax=Kozakia baliensis TaxID=153496 RepID=UPI000495AC91|nr:hypothetical protein [Kozakia baliensis]
MSLPFLNRFWPWREIARLRAEVRSTRERVANFAEDNARLFWEWRKAVLDAAQLSAEIERLKAVPKRDEHGRFSK